MDTWHA